MQVVRWKRGLLVLRRVEPTAVQLAETSARGECRIQTWANTVRKPLLLVGAATSTLPFRAELWSETLRIVRQRSGLRLMERGKGIYGTASGDARSHGQRNRLRMVRRGRRTRP